MTTFVNFGAPESCEHVITRRNPKLDDWASHPTAELGTDFRSLSNCFAMNLAPDPLRAKSDKKYVPSEFGDTSTSSLQPLVKRARNGQIESPEVLDEN